MNRPKKQWILLAVALTGGLIAADLPAQGRRTQQGRAQQGRAQQGRGQQGRAQQGPGRKGPAQQAVGNQAGNMGQGENRPLDGLQGDRFPNLSVADARGLIFLREEEKLARDVYQALSDKWGARVFRNIGRAESQHMMVIGKLLANYGLNDPIKNNAAGVFVTPQFQKLYDSLVAAGSNSLTDALKVGLKIEEMDIADLRVAIQSTRNQDIQRALTNLLRGSENHLRAFASGLNALGGKYTPTSLSQAEFDQIANQGPGQGNGQGNGQGKRKGFQQEQNGNGKGRRGQQRNQNGRGGGRGGGGR